MKVLLYLGILLTLEVCLEAATILDGPLSRRSGGDNPHVKCQGKSDGFYADFNNECRQFFRCYSREASTYHCADGLKFNENVRACMLEESVDCTPPKDERHVEAKSTDDVEAVTFSCDGREDGFYADYASQCSQYFLCREGKMTTTPCKEGLKFSEDVRACIHPEDVFCPDFAKKQFEVREEKSDAEIKAQARQIKFRKLEELLGRLKNALNEDN